MPRRRKAVSAKQARKRARQVSESTLGTHVQRGTHARRGAGAQSVSFSDSRMSTRASRSQVDVLTPRTSTAEGRSAYRQRTQQRRQVEVAQRRSRRRGAFLVVVALVAAVGIAVGAGALAFRGSLGSQLALADSDATEMLVQVKSTDPYYAVVTVELGAAAEPLQTSGPDIILLARVDRQEHEVALVNIPPNLQVTVGNAPHRLAEIATWGDAALIEALSTFAKVDVSHIAKVARGGTERFVDAVGGVQVQVEQEIDDPHAGDLYIPQGTYTLNDQGALTYLRATNLTLGVADQLSNQVSFAAEMLCSLCAGDGLTRRLDSVAGYFQTDLSLGDLEDLASWAGQLSAKDVTCVALPGYLTTTSEVVDMGEQLFVCPSADIADIVAALEAGETPAVNLVAEAEVAQPGTFTVEVQNGTDIAGAAAVTADALSQAGFSVSKAGNAEQQVYDETLVIYKEDSLGPGRAKAVINALGIGRAVDGSLYYSFDDDVLVIIGYDYKPVS